MFSPVERTFVQVGATRDGLDPYLRCARKRGMTAVLVETAAYLKWRRMLGRQPFDVEIATDQPADAADVVATLERHHITPSFMLTGFERYAGCGFAVARKFGVAPWPAVGYGFAPVDKYGQRAALARNVPDLAQPGYARRSPYRLKDTALSTLRFPQVVKPTDGGGGLGVFYVEDEHERDVALCRLRSTTNYDGGAFADVLVEEHVDGVEYSLQGIVYDGAPLLLSMCEKITALEPVHGEPRLRGFREIGHIGLPGSSVPARTRAFAAACVSAVGYREGPFHVDFIDDGERIVFIEMGFRLSGGGLVALVERVTGVDWAELVFATHLGERAPELPSPSSPSSAPSTVVGQVTLVDEQELAIADTLRRQRSAVDVQRARLPVGEVSAEDGPRLVSDRSRHSGLGRVIAGGPLAQVRDDLRGCVAGRLGVRACAG
jgi:hypothetical protein